MEKTKVQATSGGLGIWGLLQVAFIIGKVFGIGPIKEWSWVKVFIPTFISLGLGLALVILAVVLYIVFYKIPSKK